MVLARGWGMGSGYNISVLQDKKSSGDLFHSSVNILNTIKLYP